eukprot:4119809-Pleurochrysis_carterae.AAC.1
MAPAADTRPGSTVVHCVEATESARSCSWRKCTAVSPGASDASVSASVPRPARAAVRDAVERQAQQALVDALIDFGRNERALPHEHDVHAGRPKDMAHALFRKVDVRASLFQIVRCAPGRCERQRADRLVHRLGAEPRVQRALRDGTVVRVWQSRCEALDADALHARYDRIRDGLHDMPDSLLREVQPRLALLHAVRCEPVPHRGLHGRHVRLRQAQHACLHIGRHAEDLRHADRPGHVTHAERADALVYERQRHGMHACRGQVQARPALVDRIRCEMRLREREETVSGEEAIRLAFAQSVRCRACEVRDKGMGVEVHRGLRFAQVGQARVADAVGDRCVQCGHAGRAGGEGRPQLRERERDSLFLLDGVRSSRHVIGGDGEQRVAEAFLGVEEVRHALAQRVGAAREERTPRAAGRCAIAGRCVLGGSTVRLFLSSSIGRWCGCVLDTETARVLVERDVQPLFLLPRSALEHHVAAEHRVRDVCGLDPVAAPQHFHHAP